MKSIKAFSLFFIVTLFAALTTAQTPFSNDYFSATFNGPVSTGSARQATSTTTAWYSGNNGVYQYVVVRVVDHDIAVNQTSADFYADTDTASGGAIENRSTDTWEGHPVTYTGRKYTDPQGFVMFKRARFIIENSRTVISIQQFALYSLDDKDQWQNFVSSLKTR
jgi:hypothetical protein